jgi:hypothetical protein
VALNTQLDLNFPSFGSHMEDQKGNPIILPQKEKKTLMLAVAFHEKGRSALKKENFSEALILLLDADIEFM